MDEAKRRMTVYQHVFESAFSLRALSLLSAPTAIGGGQSQTVLTHAAEV